MEASECEPVPWDRVAAELLRAIRGARSQVAFARRLGYSGNPIAKWEAGKRAPTGVEAFRAARLAGIDVTRAITTFNLVASAAFEEGDLGPWLRTLAGDTSQKDLSIRSGLSRQSVGRILRGEASPRLPELLALIDAATGRVADLVAMLVDMNAVPALARQAEMRRAVRQLAFDEPWSPGVLAVLAASPDAGPQRLASALDIPVAEAERLRALVSASGLLTEATTAGPTVDVETNAAAQRRLREHWARVGADRLAAGHPAVFSYNVFAVSRADLEKIHSLQRAFFREVRGLVAESEPEVAAFLLVMTGALE